MAQKNETSALVVALMLTLGLIAGGLWFASKYFNFGNLGGWFQGGGSSNPSTNQPPGQAGDTFASIANVPSGLFNYGGSTSWAPVRGQVDPVIQQTWPAFQLRYTNPTTGTPGSAAGIRMLLDGQISIAQSSRPLEDEEYQRAQQRGYTLNSIPVALEGIAIAVHPSLTVPGITLEQLRGIYMGQITNWRQVGGPDLAILPYTRRIEDGGTVEFFINNVLGGQAFAPSVQRIATTTEALRAVGNNPGGIYYASAPEIVGQCTTKPLPLGTRPDNFVPPYQEPLVPASQCPAQRNQINVAAIRKGDYPITRSLFVVVKQDGQLDQRAGEAYANLLLTEQGQSLLEQAGFVRIR